MTSIEENESVGAVLVCGGGIAGIQASLDLASGGFKVFLLDTAAAIGGRMAQLDKTFPAGDCAMCILSPKLVETARNRNIEILTLADIEDVSGWPGHFKVRVRRNPRYVDVKKCEACGSCASVCPVNLPNEFDGGLSLRKAIHQTHPQAIPGAYGISKAAAAAPCKESCPAGVNVPGATALVAAGKIPEAYALVRRRCPFPGVSGRVCPHPCQTPCNRVPLGGAVGFGNLERFVGDYALAHPDAVPRPAPPARLSDARIAVVGGGPSGLTAASDLALLGYGVTLFEAEPQLGGMLRYGIPEFRLPREVLDAEIRDIVNLGVEVRTGTKISWLKDLLEGGAQPGAGDRFQAVFVATGAWGGRKLGIPGEEAQGVMPALSFLRDVNAGNTPVIGPDVCVIGGSDLALDAARCAVRLPGVKNVRLACMEGREEMLVSDGRVAEAVEEGVELRNGLDPTRIETEGDRVSFARFRACTSVYDMYRGFRRYNPLYDDSRVTAIRADTILIAGGRAVDASWTGLELRPGGRILADPDSLATNVRGIFAGGDAATGPASLVGAVAQGHAAAESIDAAIRCAAGVRSAGTAGSAASVHVKWAAPKFAPNPRPEAPPQGRVPMPLADAGLRRKGMAEVRTGFDLEQAVREAGRCLACGLCAECMECVKVCSAGAIVLDQKAVETEIEVGSIIFAPGAAEFQAAAWEELGYGRLADVVTSLQFERMLAAAGPTDGRIARPSDGGAVRRIAFVQCVGSRDPVRGDAHCSSVCCMTAIKDSVVALERNPGAPLDVSIFCTDVRAFGKEFDGLADRAADAYGVNFVRATECRVAGIPDGGGLRLAYRDAGGEERRQEFDLVVLSVGTRMQPGVKETAAKLRLDLDESGFARTGRLRPLASSSPGVYVAGAFQEPKDIPDSVAQGSAAAACAMRQLTTVRGTMTQPLEYPWERDTADEAPRVGVFVCRCGNNISSVVDVGRVAAAAAGMPAVVHAEDAVYTCSDANQQHIKALIRKHRINRLVVASCSSRTHEVLFQETLRECGLNRFLMTMTNIRDQCAWVHRDDPDAATGKAVDLVAMAVARARRLQAQPLYEIPVTAAALVLGGGLAGMTAARNIAGQGYRVHLVEQAASLGGLMRDIRKTVEGIDVQAHLRQLAEQVLSDPRITVHLNSTLVRTAGQAGDFTSVLDTAGRETTVEHGVVIVATGGRERSTRKFLHGTHPRVITQSRLESVLAEGGISALAAAKPDASVVMIQCVESRDERNPYCGRVCCTEAVKNALELKRTMPRADVVIVGRDMRTFGFRELHYRKALEQGVRFVRQAGKDLPELDYDNGLLCLRVRTDAEGRTSVFTPDLLVLSAGVAPAAGNPALAAALRGALTADGFFQEAHSKLRPVDLANEGQFLCGLAHSPRFMDETIAQAQAAAGRAAAILSKSRLEIMGRIAFVDAAGCVACATCVKICPYGAPRINELRKAEIQSTKCLGCGSCASACPARTITMQHQEGETVAAMLEEMLVGGTE